MTAPLVDRADARAFRGGESWLSRTLRSGVGVGVGALALAGAIVATPSAALAQDDQLQTDNAWALEQMQVDGAWATTKGEGVTVAVVDTGVSEHPYFEGKNVEAGHSIYEGEDGRADNNGHGTGVASAVLSVAPEATILPVRYMTGTDAEGLTGGVSGSTQTDAIKWAVDNDADVIVMAFGVTGSEPTEYMLDALQYAVDSGVVLVSGMGNDPNGEAGYPPEIPGVVAVAGTDESGGPWAGGTTGPESEIAAPASSMTVAALQEESSGWGGGGDQDPYTTEEGTSISTGLVGGAAALVKSANPDVDGNNVVNRLIQTAGEGGGENHSDELGFGIVNADQAANADDIETVDENPLGYPMGEPGASGVEPESGGSDGGSDAEDPTEEAAAEESGTGLSTIIVIAAAVVLVGAAVAVWLVLRGRSRKSVTSAQQPGAFNPQSGPVPGGFQQPPGPAQQQQQYSAPPMNQGQPVQPGPQGYNPPPNGGPQSFTPPPAPPSARGESSPPWGPNDPNQR